MPYIMEDPTWQALHRECTLVHQILGSGATSIGRANYADKRGEYYIAFFALSTGIERLSKIIITINYMLKEEGKTPENSYFRKFGHNIELLISECKDIHTKSEYNVKVDPPEDEITNGIINSLNAFSDARRGRYANFTSLRDPDFAEQQEPLRGWWIEVAERILNKHFRGTWLEERAIQNAKKIQKHFGEMMFIEHTSEDGSPMRDLYSASLRTGETKCLQKYSRYYTLVIIRWLSELLISISFYAYQSGIKAAFGHWEIFYPYCNDDKYLKTRKTWPP
ncbi:hypothetical protein [Oceanicaulis sp.]|uniref:hypothetical protein n=1 Tax=Oceanicaulis sp. TaxID=1924941 RepID=UPI003F71A24E